MYISDADKLSSDMGQFEAWHGKLFYYSCERLGWKFIRNLNK